MDTPVILVYGCVHTHVSVKFVQKASKHRKLPRFEFMWGFGRMLRIPKIVPKSSVYSLYEKQVEAR